MNEIGTDHQYHTKYLFPSAASIAQWSPSGPHPGKLNFARHPGAPEALHFGAVVTPSALIQTIVEEVLLVGRWEPPRLVNDPAGTWHGTDCRTPRNQMPYPFLQLPLPAPPPVQVE